MKKRLTFVLIAVALSIVAILLYLKHLNNQFKSDKNKNEAKTLIDSLNIDSAISLYWYKYNDGNSETDISFMYLGKSVCDCNIKDASLGGEFIYGIKEVKHDSIFILSRLGFNVINTQKPFHFVNVPVISSDDSIRHIERCFSFQDLCK